MLPLSDDGEKIFPFWIIVIIFANVFIFFLELTAPNPDLFIESYALIPSSINFFQLSTISTFITSQFLHGGFLHIISNMWFLWIFGDNIEKRFGPLIFPVFYLLSGTVGNFLQYLLEPSSTIPMLGASGAVAGILGAYFALFPRNKVKTLVFVLFFVTIVDIPASMMLFYWFIIQLFSGAAAVSSTADVGGIAWFAHIGGFATGWLIAKLRP